MRPRGRQRYIKIDRQRQKNIKREREIEPERRYSTGRTMVFILDGKEEKIILPV